MSYSLSFFYFTGWFIFFSPLFFAPLGLGLFVPAPRLRLIVFLVVNGV